MASDSRDPHLPRPSDAAPAAGTGSAADHPPTTSSSPPSSSSDRNVKLHCSYGGLILPRGTDGALRYIGGTTRLITVTRDSSFADVLRRMADLCGGPVVLRYQLPDDDIDSLVSVLNAEDLEHMMEEHDRLAADFTNAKLRVFLFSTSGVPCVGADVLPSYHDPHDVGMRYLGAFDGLRSSRSRNDGTMSLSSTPDSDGGAMNEGSGTDGGAMNEGSGTDGGAMNEGTGTDGGAMNEGSGTDGGAMNEGSGTDGGTVDEGSGTGTVTDGGTKDVGGMATTEKMVNEYTGTGMVNDDGMLPEKVSLTSTSVQADRDPLSGACTSHQTELPSSTPFEWPSFVSKISSSIQSELPYVPPYPQHQVENQHAQMMDSQYIVLVGFSPLVGVVGVPARIICPTSLAAANETLIQTRVHSHLKNPSIGNTKELPGDFKFQPLTQVPPLPSAHLLPSTSERNESHHVDSSSQGLTTITEDCSLNGKTLLHVHPDALTCKKHSDFKDVVSDANAVLPSHHPEGLTRMRAPQGVDVRSLADTVVEIQSDNLVAAPPSKASEHPGVIPETPQGGERVVNLDLASVCMPNTSQAPYANVSVINPPKSCEANLDLADILVPPVSACMRTTSQAPHPVGTVTNPPKYCEGANLHLADILIPPVSVCTPTTLPAQYPIETLINPPRSCEAANMDLADILGPPVSACMPTSSQTSTVNIGFPNHATNQDINSKPLVSDTSSVRNLETRTDGLSIHGTETTLVRDCVRPINLAMGALSKIPPGAPVFSDQQRAVVMSDVCTSKYFVSEEPPLVTVNTLNTGQNNRANEPSFSSTDHVLIDQRPSVVKDVAYLQCSQPPNSSHSSNTTATHGPHSYHVEAGVEQRGMFKHLGAAYSNDDASKQLIVEHKDEAPIFHPVDMLSDTTIPQRDISQLYSGYCATNLDQLQKVIVLDSLLSNMDHQEAQASGVSSQQLITTKEFLNKNCPGNEMSYEITASAESSLSNLPDFLNIDPPIEVACPIEDLEEICVKPDIQIFEGRVSVPASEVPVPVPALSSHETKAINPDKEFGTVENNIARENGQIETTKTKDSEKIMHGFPNSDEIGSLQVIRNGDLEELQKLGSGSFGTVYHGKWRGSDVEIKRINDQVFSRKPSEQEHARADFWNEARKLASLHHPNVVAFYGIVLDDPGGSIATVTEFMVNGSLQSALQKKDKTLDRRGCLLIAMDVAFGMEYLHSKKIIHFDLKSENLLVNLRDPQRPICKVGDLGLSKVKYDALVSGGMQGSLPWMAPELFAGKDDMFNEKVDVFSFGIVMWELLTGERPYKDMHYAAIIGGVLKDTLRPPVPESCEPEWRLLMEQCWSTEPLRRPSFTEIASRLRAMEASVPEK